MAFLESLGTAAASSASSALAGGLGNLIAGAISGNAEGRISHERFMENEQRADWHAEREVERQGDFLENIAPRQASAYNTYQDDTYANDTARQIGRVQDMSSQLGMSPWELNQGSAATPSPAADFGGPREQPTGGREFLQSLTALKTAEMQNKTQLQIAAMNNQTSLQNTAMQTDQGELPKANTLLAVQQLHNYIASEQLTNSQRENTDWNTQASKLGILLQALPKQTLSLGPLSQTNTVGGPELSKLLGAWQNGGSIQEQDGLAAYLKSLPKDQWSSLWRDAERATTLLLKQGQRAVSGVGDFLSNLGKKK